MKKLLALIPFLMTTALSFGQGDGTNITITIPPQSQTEPLGGSVTLSVTATGTGPFKYEWQLNGTNLANSIAGVITTVAGNGNASDSGDGGAATNASLSGPSGVALDAFGDLYIAELNGGHIREVAANGIITTVAGGGSGGDSGPAANSSLNQPYDLAFDASGNLFITEHLSSRILEVSSNGIITTVAGNGNAGYSGDSGAATNANLNYPYGLALDASGNLYIADSFNSRIRKVDNNGIITTVAGNGNAGYSGDGGAAIFASVNQPRGVALDAFGNLYIADTWNNRIRKVDTNGIITSVAGNGNASDSGDGGAATNASLYSPNGVASDAFGNLYIADTGNGRIRELSAGVITTVAGGGSDGLGDGGAATNASLNSPTSLRLDAFGNLYVADYNNNRVREVGVQGGPTLTINNVSATNAGNYRVIVSNPYGSVTSSVAVLQIGPAILVNGQQAAGTVLVTNSAQVTILSSFTGGYLFYTLDGTTPTTSSALYGEPVTLTNTATIQVMNLSADFSQVVYAIPVTVQIIPVYTLQTSAAGSGTVSVSPASGPYPSNSVVQLTASPSQYWAFDHWSGDASGYANPISVTMTGPLNIQGVFVPSAYPLTVGTAGGGSITVNGQTIDTGTFYSAGSVVSITATASNGWSFIDWQGTATGTSNPLNLPMNSTNNIQAVFGTTVAVSSVGGGSIFLSQPNPIPFGTLLTLSAVPSSGSFFVTWGGVAAGTTNPTTVVVTTNNPTASALFSPLPQGKLSLSVVIVGSGTVNISPQKNYYDVGDGVTLTASTTNAGFAFYGWSQGAIGTNNPLTVLVTSNIVVQANFVGSPTVTVSPPSLNIVATSNAVLTATASGLPPLTYQWQDSQGSISGATNSTFNIYNAQATNTDDYSVIVSNPYGSVTSAVVTVTVAFPPLVTSQSVGQTVAAGTPVTLSVTNTGTPPLNYQWVDSLGPISGATNASFSLNPAQTNNWDNYFVVVSNAYGSVTSTVIPLIVYGPVTISSQPMSQVVPLDAPATFVVIAGGFPAPLYQWALNGTNLVGATSNTVNITSVDLPNLGNYQVLVYNGYSSTNSYVAALDMSPSLDAPFTGATTIWGEGAILSVGAVGSGQLGYQWYLNGVPIDGATGATLDFSNIQFTNAGLYSVVVSSPYGTITNAAYQVVVNPAGVTLGLAPTLTISGVTGYSYILQSSTNLGNTNAWVTLTNLTLTQPVELWVDTNVDASSPFNPKTFYRVLPGQ